MPLEDLDDDERLLTQREVAHFLHINVNTLQRIPHHLLPFYRVTARGDRRYSRPEVLAYLSRDWSPDEKRVVVNYFGNEVCAYCGYHPPQHGEDCDRPPEEEA